MKRRKGGDTISHTRIAHILPFPAIGGTEIGQLRIMKAARKVGLESFVFYLPDAPVVGKFFENAGFEAVPQAPPQPSFRYAAKFYSQSRALSGELRHRGATIVHCADVLAAYHAGAAARMAGLPLISHVRNRYAALPFRERFFLRTVQRWVFVSNNTWEQFCIPVASNHGTVLYDGIPVEQNEENHGTGAVVRAEFGLSPETQLAGMFARVAPQKDFETLAAAAALLAPRFPHLRFLIVGDNDSTGFIQAHYAQVQRWLEQYKVTNLFIFTGFRQDVPQLMRAADLFVLSTHGEGLPLVLLEAMSHRRPVIATAVDGIPELIKDGETGLLAPHGDSGALADAIGKIVADSALAGRLGNNGRQIVETLFSQEAFEGRVANLYRNLLGKR